MEPNNEAADSESNPKWDKSTFNHQGSPSSISRRATMGLLGLGGLGLLGTQPAAAQSIQWRTDVDAGGNRLLNLGALAMEDDFIEITDFDGSNLDVVDGVLNATDTRTNVSDNGTIEVSNTTDINFGENLSVTLDGDGSVTVDVVGVESQWADLDTDGLLETDSTGIDVDTVETDYLSVANVGTSVELSDPQVISAGAQSVVVQFDTEVFDHRDEYDTTNHQFVAQNSGTYNLSVYLTIGFGDTSTFNLSVRKFFSDGRPGPALASVSSSGKNLTHLSLSRLVRLTKDDIIKVELSNIATTDDRTIFPREQSAFSISQVG